MLLRLTERLCETGEMEVMIRNEHLDSSSVDSRDMCGFFWSKREFYQSASCSNISYRNKFIQLFSIALADPMF